MRRLRLFAVALVMLLVAAGCAGDDGDGGGGGGGGGGGVEQEEDTGQINVLNALSAEEGEALQTIIDDMITPEVDYQVEIEASDQFEEQFQIRAEAGTLDLILLPQPGAIPDKIDTAVSLEDLGFDLGELGDTFGEYYLSLGEVDGEHYGFPTNANYKSMVWYPKDDFDAAGYEVPTTWDELIALSDQIVADGGTPWCVGFESGTATGWPATDWLEEIVLKTAGVETYQQWATHEIPFNDPVVVEAAEMFGQIMFTEGYVLGGADQTVAIPFGDAPAPMFEDPPGCWLHHQATFISAFFPEGTEAGVDYDWFPFPAIETDDTLMAGELAVAFSNRAEIVDFLERFSSEDVQCAMAGDPALGRLSPNVNVGEDCYANPILGEASQILAEALANGTAGFDAGDQMPAQVGSGSFWTGMVEYMQGGPESLQGVLEDIEASWPES
ncbi:MAG TPA: ABC transporter substrate-binding protein [Actinomycetota bacterium]|jgi:alpha-glucoside transport system substrate-binding protein|nr:ABC transporter substrate-binding protein [Actinomycetota bacterium]